MQFDNEKLNLLMEQNGMNASQLGNIINRSKSVISQYRSGDVSPGRDSWYAIALVFNKSFEYFIRDSDTKI